MFLLSTNQIDELKNQWNALELQTFDIFGLDCVITYPPKVKTTTKSNVIPKNSVSNSRNISNDNYVDNNNYTIDDVTDIVKLKIYWTPKDWLRYFGLTSIPNNSVVAICKQEDEQKIKNSAKITYDQYNFVLKSDISLFGLNKEYRYMILEKVK
jgi:hypothetical protein